MGVMYIVRLGLGSLSDQNSILYSRFSSNFDDDHNILDTSNPKRQLMHNMHDFELTCGRRGSFP